MSFISRLALECKVEEANPLIALNAWRIVQGIQVENEETFADRPIIAGSQTKPIFTSRLHQ